MKLYASINDNASFKKIFDYVDGVVVGLKDYSISTNAMCLEEIKEFINKTSKLNKDIIIDVNGIYTNEQLETLKVIIKELVDYNILLLYSNIAIHMILKELGCENKGIYDPKTHITNSNDMLIYMMQNMHALVPSLEIPLSDVMRLNDVKTSKIWYKAFGYHQMFHSKRQLITTYQEFKDKEKYVSNNMFLKEEKRDVLYRITQNDMGTVIYRDYLICLIKEVANLKKLDYIYLDSQFILPDTFEIVCKTFCKALNDIITPNDAYEVINRLSLNIEDGFTYSDTIYLKEQF